MSKRLEQERSLVDPLKNYSVEEASAIVKKFVELKFDKTLELSFHLGIDPRKVDQMVRGDVILPHGTGKVIRIAVIANGEQAQKALDLGVEFVGSQDLIQKIEAGWFDFDVLIATPDMMKEVGKLGRILGVRGLMPSPKNGTVTQDVESAIKAIQSGKINFKSDKTGGIHCVVGKVSFSEQQISDNVLTVIRAVHKEKPASSKGKYFKKVVLSATMSPGLVIDTVSLGM